jgi:SAM-dependent methyltransferase
VIERAARELGLTRESTVLDLAAGTGVLTRALRERFAHVVAVEPDAGMRAQFDGDVLEGTAEAIPLADGSVDAVFVAEAFHWFEPEPALREIRRVAGGLAVLSRSWGETEQPGLLPPPFWVELEEIWRRFHGNGTRDDFPDWRDTVKPTGRRASRRPFGSRGATLSTCTSRRALPRRSRSRSGRRSQRGRIR